MLLWFRLTRLFRSLIPSPVPVSRTTFQPRVEGLEERAVPAAPVLNALNTSRSWVTYAPSGSDTTGTHVTRASIQADLQKLRSEGFTGIVTYEMTEPYKFLPQDAKAAGFTWVIAGMYNVGNPKLGEEETNAEAAVAFIDAFVVGNEGLHDNRYSWGDLTGAIAYLRGHLSSARPITTTETSDQYAMTAPHGQELVQGGRSAPTTNPVFDWVFPNIQPWFDPNNSTHNVPKAVQNALNIYSSIYADAQRLNPGRIVVAKEIWWPGGVPGQANATVAMQGSFFAALAISGGTFGPVKFCWGESFNQPWKGQTSTDPLEKQAGPYWGLHTANGTPKLFVPALQAFWRQPYTSTFSSTIGSSPFTPFAYRFGLPFTPLAYRFAWLRLFMLARLAP